MLPFGRNRGFVGRQPQLKQLINILHDDDSGEDCQRVALVGLGGVGKTQIALECAFQIQEVLPGCSVYWVRASDTTSFDNSYRDIAQQLKIPGLENDKADVKQLVKTRLCQDITGKWLMIVDGANDYKIFYSGNDDNGFSALSKYLPSSPLGAILFTTRDRGAATKYACSNAINVEEMDDGESRELLQRSLQNQQLIKDKDSVITLLKYLVNLPLAIMQVAAYLNAKMCTIAEYLEVYEESNDNIVKLLSKDFEDIRRYPDMKNPVATTWLISFELIQVRDPLAADYMAFISCIREQDIPRDLLPPASKYDKTEAFGTLKAFGFIKERLSGASYDMHQLVHIAMQNWLKLKNQWKSWNEKTLNQITNVFPWLQHGNRDIWMTYLPHVQCVINMFEKTFGEMKDLPLSLLHNLGEASRIIGKYAEAEGMNRRILQYRETVLGKDHPDTFNSMNSLALSLRLQGKYAVAEEMHQRALQCRETLLGKEHPDTFGSMNDLAESLRGQGKNLEAESMHQKTLRLREALFGKDHLYTLESMNNLALSLRGQGKNSEAEVMHRQAIELGSAALGNNHPSTLNSMNNLALLLYQQGKYAAAEGIQRRTLQLRKIVLGKDHPSTLTSMHNLAETLRKQGKNTEADAIH